MKVAVLALVALAATGCMSRGEASGEGKAGATALEISVSLKGRESLTKLWTLRCPAGGTLPSPARACSRLEALDHPFAPVPRKAVCTLVYGGPKVADVSGTFKGRPVKAHFSRGDGCEIARWNRVRFLFPY